MSWCETDSPHKFHERVNQYYNYRERRKVTDRYRVRSFVFELPAYAELVSDGLRLYHKSDYHACQDGKHRHYNIVAEKVEKFEYSKSKYAESRPNTVAEGAEQTKHNYHHGHANTGISAPYLELSHDVRCHRLHQRYRRRQRR